jgi:hypothetical protein
LGRSEYGARSLCIEKTLLIRDCTQAKKTVTMSNFIQHGVSCLAQLVLSNVGGLMHTKDILAAALLDAGLPKMAVRAAEGYYHDYLSPLPMPEKKLCDELTTAGTAAASALRERVKQDYDASEEEEEEEEEAWAASPEGVAATQAFAAKFGQRRA